MGPVGSRALQSSNVVADSSELLFQEAQGPEAVSEGALFCLAPKMKEATSNEMAFLVSDK